VKWLPFVACYFIPRGRVFFSPLFSSLSLFLPLVLPFLGVFSLAGSFRCLFLLLFLGALYVAWVFFYVGLFLAQGARRIGVAKYVRQIGISRLFQLKKGMSRHRKQDREKGNYCCEARSSKFELLEFICNDGFSTSLL
jgi:hypothetical protein